MHLGLLGRVRRGGWGGWGRVRACRRVQSELAQARGDALGHGGLAGGGAGETLVLGPEAGGGVGFAGGLFDGREADAGRGVSGDSAVENGVEWTYSSSSSSAR